VIGAVAEWLEGAVGSLGHLLDPTGEILGKLWPPVLAVIATVALLRVVRWTLLLWRGRTPRVQISNFAWASAEGASEEAAWVTSLFREQLAALRLDGLDPLPECAPGAPLVELVEGVGQGVGRDIGSAAGRLFRSAWPDSAYEVWATLRPRKGGGGGRISVQLIERRRGNRTLLNVALEETNWDTGAREAAMAVAGALYPRVRRRDRGPWTLWENNVPRALLTHYHAARGFEEEDCLEPALAEYHTALDLDPLNPNLRLKIAMLQERMDLYIDAWVTYEAIVDESDRRAWRGPNRRVYLLALYRLAVMLSNGRVPSQWVKGGTVETGEGFLRDEERHERRKELLGSMERHPLFGKRWIRLSPNKLPERLTWIVSFLIRALRSKYLLFLLRTIDEEVDEPKDALEVFRQSSEDKEREHRIEAVLQILALRRLEELEGSLRPRPTLFPRKMKDWWTRHPPPRQWLSRGEFSKSAVRTSKLLVRIRTAASLEDQVNRGDGPGGAADRDKWIREIRQAHRKLTKRWPFPPVGVVRTVLHFLAPRRRWANRREDSWQLHYNAACATASLLRGDSVLGHSQKEKLPAGKAKERVRALPGKTDKKSIFRRAIAQLEEYAYRAGSDRVAAQADWVTLDDPDLGGLRESPEFELWASHHLPRALPRGLPSRKTDVKRFTARLVRDGARIFAVTWRERALVARSNPSAAEIIDWWRSEDKLWRGLENACREHLSWQERLKWLKTLQGWLDAAERDDKIDFSHEARGTAAVDSMSERLFDELALLASSPNSGNGAAPNAENGQSVLEWVGERSQYVRDAHAAGEEQADASGALRAMVEHEEALRAAQVWARLVEALEVELSGTEQRVSDDELAEMLDEEREEEEEERRQRHEELCGRMERVRQPLRRN
jgi:plasmid stabilization system protein ParE